MPLSYYLCDHWLKTLGQSLDHTEGGRCFDHVKWSDNYKDSVWKTLLSSWDELYTVVENIDVHSSASVSETTDRVTSILNEITSDCKYRVSSDNNNMTKLHVETKPWFDDSCKEKQTEYLTALSFFSKHKSYSNLVLLRETKWVYKLYANRKKHKYEKFEGNKLSLLHRVNTKLSLLHRVNTKLFIVNLRTRKQQLVV